MCCRRTLYLQSCNCIYASIGRPVVPAVCNREHPTDGCPGSDKIALDFPTSNSSPHTEYAPCAGANGAAITGEFVPVEISNIEPVFGVQLERHRSLLHFLLVNTTQLVVQEVRGWHQVFQPLIRLHIWNILLPPAPELVQHASGAKVAAEEGGAVTCDSINWQCQRCLGSAPV